MNNKQQVAYDKTCDKIRERFGSTHAIAVHSHLFTGKIITGETVRQYIVDRRMPTDFAFVLYEMMNWEINPLSLTPELARYVKMKAAPKSG